MLPQQFLKPRKVVGHELGVLTRQVAQFPRPPTRPARSANGLYGSRRSTDHSRRFCAALDTTT